MVWLCSQDASIGACLHISALRGVDTEIESWSSQDLHKTSASAEPVSGPDYCQVGSVLIADNCSLRAL